MYVQVIGDTATYITLTDLRFAYPNISFPAVITDEDAAQFDVYPCAEVPAPTADYTKNVIMGDPVESGDGWAQTWIITDASEQEIADRVMQQWESVRTDRNQRLADCDWTQLPDAPVDAAAWAEYRQALRDITMQPDPFNIVWPTTPGA